MGHDDAHEADQAAHRHRGGGAQGGGDHDDQPHPLRPHPQRLGLLLPDRQHVEQAAVQQHHRRATRTAYGASRPTSRPPHRAQPPQDPRVHLADRVGVALLHEGLHRGEEGRHRHPGQHQGRPASAALRRRHPARRRRPPPPTPPAKAAIAHHGRARARPSRSPGWPRGRRRRPPRAGRGRPAGCETPPGRRRRRPPASPPPGQPSTTRGSRRSHTMAAWRSDRPESTETKGSRSTSSASTRPGRSATGPTSTPARAAPAATMTAMSRAERGMRRAIRLSSPYTAAATAASKSTRRGPHREASARRPRSPSRPTPRTSSPSRDAAATVSAVWPQQAASPRKMKSGSAAMTNSADSCGYPPPAASAMLAMPSSP